MNQRAPSRLARTRFQARADLEAVAQKNARLALVDASKITWMTLPPEACNPNVEAGAIQETQSKQWYRPMFRHQTKDGRVKIKKMQLSTQPVQSNDRDALAEAWATAAGTTLDEHNFHASGTSRIVVKLRRHRILGRRRAWQLSEPTLKGDRCSRSETQLSWWSLLNTRRG